MDKEILNIIGIRKPGKRPLEDKNYKIIWGN